LITPEKIEEWVRELEERPSSGAILVRYVANRLRDLAQRNEELLAENIQLRTGKKVEEYEERIANLQYQLELLKRQLGGEPAEDTPTQVSPETTNIFLYNPLGEVLRIEQNTDQLASRMLAGRFTAPLREEEISRRIPRLLVTGSHEELLFLFNTGRTATIPAADIPVCAGALDWKQAFLEEPRGAEELAVISAIGRMSLSDSCIQSSRRGCVKKMMRSAFESYVARNYVGPGVRQSKDQPLELTLCGKNDQVVLASEEGFTLTLETAGLSYTAEETIRLNPTDHMVSSFAVGNKKLVVFLTHNGKAISREVSWLKPAAGGTSKTRGQPVFSEERRKTGTRVVGAAAVDESDWGAVLDSAGNLTIYQMGDLAGAGSVSRAAGTDEELLAFAVF